MPHFTTSDGKRLYYEDRGEGRPLICLAGLTRNCRDFSFLAPHLDELRMIAMDYRGRGRSDHDPDFTNYNIVQESRDVIDLIDHLELDRVAVLGTSRGGLIAMTLATSDAERLDAVILNDIGPVVAPGGLERIMGYVGLPPAARTLDEMAETLKAAMEEEFPGVPLERWREQASFQFEETADGLALRYDARLRDALLAQAEAGPAPDLWPLFEALSPLPTGVIRGANSDLLTAETLAEMQARRPSLIAAEVPARGHVPFLDEPEALDVIRRVLDAP
ncbi:Pimeloyl-ACP methyl ester carboxylesterase [Cribrihabitans marinus]|uniref:Pimeloyl-ACP methyl ester carboxylesterase n=1 Tax=Cribrihabitans marinus TaxID=1227549 RepID=A0A1H6SCQ2_9RHOB|nr:alpha/beta hydrolase [Cribrihabitans marinus]GGH23590.1 hydrolase [Cribrihabitans marinus]SEI65783.1 Pimeloyl-ACP methyl ester carboxylesterase [Cribrihabitans marinus]